MGIRTTCVVISLLVALPAATFAQASIEGTARDSSGAVLPGVTVEAASPALIEKVRSVVTDGTGQYKIIDLRPGTYSVTFTLPGFNTFKRDGIELAGAFAATVNAELRVGELNETITVTGESPVVDVQNSRQQTVMGSEVLNTIPTGRTQFANAVLVPGINSSFQDVGGANNLAAAASALTIHGSRAGDQRLTMGGVPMANLEGSGQANNFVPNMASVQEMTVDIGAGTAEQETGGVRMNLIPREGGNSFSGSFFGTAANGAFQGSNFTDDLRNRGLRTPDEIKLNYDFNPSFGGPIVQDKVWFFSSARFVKNENYVGGVLANLNAGDPSKWLYQADPDTRGVYNLSQEAVNSRVTWQASQRNKFSFFYDHQWRCWCRRTNPNVSPESASTYHFPGLNMATATWTSPVTNKLLIEASLSRRGERFIVVKPDPSDIFASLIPVVEQSSGLVYRGLIANNATNTQPFIDNFTGPTSALASVSYVTGAHAFKFGVVDNWGTRDVSLDSPAGVGLMYRFNNGVPNQLTQYATPYRTFADLDANLGIYAQDKWTLKQLTLNVGLRFDHLGMSFPAQSAGPGPLVPNRNISFPATSWVSWKDFSPRLGVAYDVFGNRKTALKAGLNKYMVAQGLQGAYATDPITLLANRVTRNWNDRVFGATDPRSNNFVPDCDLLNPQANGECGIVSDVNFGSQTRTTTYDPEVLRGWGVRPFNWEFSLGVQQEIVSRVSANVAYYRRWYGNFAVTDNLAVQSSDYDPYSIAIPANPQLPGGGGGTLGGLFDVNPSRVGQINNLFTAASNYGEQTEYWHGFDASVNLRLSRDVLLQGGFNSGRTVTDVCDIVQTYRNKVAVTGAIGTPQSTDWCHLEEIWRSQVKLLGVYTVPRVDVQLSATVQSLPGPQISANRVVPTAEIAASLGRPLAGQAANATINMIRPGTMYGERLNQIDLRFGKLFRFGGTRASVNLDVFNALNSNAVLTENFNYASWRAPLTILQPRFAKFSVQLDF
jgi:hypothetical protein